MWSGATGHQVPLITDFEAPVRLAEEKGGASALNPTTTFDWPIGGSGNRGQDQSHGCRRRRTRQAQRS